MVLAISPLQFNGHAALCVVAKHEEDFVTCQDSWHKEQPRRKCKGVSNSSVDEVEGSRNTRISSVNLFTARRGGGNHCLSRDRSAHQWILKNNLQGSIHASTCKSLSGGLHNCCHRCLCTRGEAQKQCVSSEAIWLLSASV